MLKCIVFAFDYKGFASLQAQPQSTQQNLHSKENNVLTLQKYKPYCLSSLSLTFWRENRKQANRNSQGFLHGFLQGFCFLHDLFPKKSNNSDDQFFSTFQFFINIYLFNFTPDRNVNKFYLHKAKSKDNFQFSIPHAGGNTKNRSDSNSLGRIIKNISL